MGCCESLPDVPENIIPDPEYEGIYTFTIRDLSAWNDDYEVYRGASPNDETDRWMWLNKGKEEDKQHGGAIIELENYRRFSEEDPDKGQVLYRCRFADKPQFDQEPSREIGGGQISGDMIASFFGGKSPTPVSHEDYYYVERAKRANHGTDRTRIVKWKLHTTCQILPVVRNDSVLCGRDPLTLKIQSNGTAVACYDRKTDPDTGEVRWERDVVEFVDCVDFALSKDDGELISEWRCPGDANELPTNAVIDTDLFQGTMKNGWKSEGDTIIESKEPYDPALCLMVGHLVTGEYSIRGIKNDFQPRFPPNP